MGANAMNRIMMPKRGGTLIMLLLLTIAAHAQQLRLGVITDFDRSLNLDLIIDQMIREIDQTTGASLDVDLVATEYGVADIASVDRAYAQLKDRVDLLLVLGSISAKQLATEKELQVPVIALGIIDPVLQDIPYDLGRSGKKNFTYVWQTRDIDSELQAFNEIHEFKHLALFVDEKASSTINTDKANNFIDSLESRFEATLTIIPVADNMEQAFSQLPTDVDAAYFTVMLSQSDAQLQQLITLLNERKIPTFTGNSRLIDKGVLGSMSNENDPQRVIRKLAIMVDGITSGSDLSTMQVTLDTKENFYVNLATAREIELSIPFEVLFTATLIGDIEEQQKTYSFKEVAEKSLAANLDIQISYQDLKQSKLDVRSVRSNLMPSLEAGLSASQINDELANAAFNSPERSLDGDLTLTQLIYSEEAIAGVKISQYLQKSQEYNTEAEVLSVLFDTYTAYLNVLSAKTNVLIQQDNLLNTKKNKELASIRVNVGSSSNSDLYRWESEVSTASQSVIDAQTTTIAAKLQLNTLLANTLEFEFDVADVSLQDDWFAYYNESTLGQMLKTPQSLKIISDFLVAESQRQNPNKKALVETINASNRQLTQNKRLLYVPTVALQAQTSQILGRGGVGSTLDQQAMAFGITELQDNSWFAGISLSYPIFSGLNRKVAIQQSKVSLDQLDNSRLSLDQNLELAVRAGVLELLTAGTNIRFSQEASASARQNFELVQDNYKQGQVTITQLIDAQQAALQARLAAALSIYEFIQAHLQLEFSIGTFSMFMSDEQLQDFNDRLQQYLTNQNQ